jgi:hypothetical protein
MKIELQLFWKKMVVYIYIYIYIYILNIGVKNFKNINLIFFLFEKQSKKHLKKNTRI